MNTETKVMGRVNSPLPLVIRRNNDSRITEASCAGVNMPRMLMERYSAFRRWGRNTQIWAAVPGVNDDLSPNTKLGDLDRNMTVQSLIREYRNSVKPYAWRTATEAEERRLLRIEADVYRWREAVTEGLAKAKLKSKKRSIEAAGRAIKRAGGFAVIGMTKDDLTQACYAYIREVEA